MRLLFHEPVAAAGVLMVALAGSAFAQEAESPLFQEARSVPYEAHVRERFSVHQSVSEWSRPRVVWFLLIRMTSSEEGLLSSFSHEDGRLLQSIAELDVRGIEWRAAEPFIAELCALPADDVRARGRLWNEAEAAAVAFDAQVASLLDGLTPAGLRRLEAHIQADNKVGKVFSTDWEAFAVDLPQAAQLFFLDKCDNYRMKIERERLFGKRSVPTYLHLTPTPEAQPR